MLNRCLPDPTLAVKQDGIVADSPEDLLYQLFSAEELIALGGEPRNVRVVLARHRVGAGHRSGRPGPRLGRLHIQRDKYNIQVFRFVSWPGKLVIVSPCIQRYIKRDIFFYLFCDKEDRRATPLNHQIPYMFRCANKRRS